jgi:hypothetical protein
MGEIVAAVGTCHTPYLFTRPPDEKPEPLDRASRVMAELDKGPSVTEFGSFGFRHGYTPGK